MLADMLTMKEHIAKPLHEIAFCYLGDARFNMGNSLMVDRLQAGHGRADLRARSRCGRPPELVETAREIADRTGARLTLTGDVDEGVAGVDFVCTDVWVSMGEANERLGGAHRAAASPTR